MSGRSESRPLKLLVLARDPGAASALAPVATRGRAEVIAFPDAAPVFERAGSRFHLVADDADPAFAGSRLDELRPDALVTGTSRRADRDGVWWAAARSRGTPSLAVLDHWDHYAERFTAHQPFDRLPDRIAVMDERALRALIGHGCPSERLVITGQPAFDTVLGAPLPDRGSTRLEWGVADGDHAILFASEPISGDRARRPYDETQALAVLIDAASTLSATLLVRAHPRQSADAILSAFPAVTLDRTADPHAAMAGADTIVGMESIFLLEAALAGAPVLSIQPSFQVYPVPGACPALIATVRTADEARAWLMDPAHQRHLDEPERIARDRECGFVPGATTRVLREVERLASRR